MSETQCPRERTLLRQAKKSSQQDDCILIFHLRVPDRGVISISILISISIRFKAAGYKPSKRPGVGYFGPPSCTTGICASHTFSVSFGIVFTSFMISLSLSPTTIETICQHTIPFAQKAARPRQQQHGSTHQPVHYSNPPSPGAEKQCHSA